MVVNIITIHREPNYGAVLQAYALYHVIEDLGYRPRIIDLSMQFRSLSYSFFTRIILKLYHKIKAYNICYDKCEEFSCKNEPNRIGPFYTIEQLKEYNWKKDDIYLVGSDQVWNPELTGNLSEAYTLAFLDDNYTKYSYGSSFGNIKDTRIRAEQLDIENTLKKFNKISVREQFGVEFLKKYGIPSEEVIDPTLLLDNYSHLLNKEPEQCRHLLYLSLGESQEMDMFVTKVSDKFNLPIEKIYGYLQPSRKDNKEFLSVEDWLHRIASAELVITDSFHATVFSILFEKPFYVYISNPSKAFRITNLLDKLGLSERILSDVIKAEDTQIDYVSVKEKLAVYRSKSICFLKEILANNEDSVM